MIGKGGEEQEKKKCLNNSYIIVVKKMNVVNFRALTDDAKSVNQPTYQSNKASQSGFDDSYNILILN